MKLIIETLSKRYSILKWTYKAKNKNPLYKIKYTNQKETIEMLPNY